VDFSRTERVRASWPDSVSLIFTVKSSDPLATRLPFGLKTTLLTESECPSKPMRFLARLRVPKRNGPVARGVGQGSAVRTVRHASVRVWIDNGWPPRLVVLP